MNEIDGQWFRRGRLRGGLGAALLLGLLASGFSARGEDIFITTPGEVAIKSAQARPGDTLIMRDGVWPNADILFSANGSAASPITLRAETLGGVALTGGSRLRIAGSFLVVDGLVFTNGFVTSGDVIAFQDTTFSVAVNCRITNCVIVDYNPPTPTTDTKWVSLYGYSNRVENCFFKGKNNLGTTLIVWVDSLRPNYHQIRRNYFGPRPPYPSNGAETIRIGTSDVSMSNSRSLVEENYFEQCNGDAEIISSKSCENVYRNNTFVECEGALSLRHGNRCTVEGNYFFGRFKPLTGGVRIVGEDHKVYNNYFVELAGTSARAPLSIMQGLVASPLNGYFQVQRAVVAFNTFVNCTNAIHSGLAGTLTGTPDATTLPPLDCAIANNIIIASAGKLIDQRIEPVNMLYEGNIFFGANLGIPTNAGISRLDPQLVFGADGLWRPGPTSPALGGAQGSYPYVATDVDGQARPGIKDIGCDQFSTGPTNNPPLRAVDVGPLWMRASGTVVSWSPPASITYGTPLGPLHLNAVANVPGVFVYNPPAGTVLNATNGRTLTLVFTPNDRISYSTVTQTVTINVLKAVPALTWSHPANLIYGTALSPVQLNATANVPGGFAYLPPAGTLLNVGSNQTLSAIFTPTDAANYEVATRTVTITVTPGLPVITWANPAHVPHGTVLGPVQLNATASVPGTFDYTPPAGTVLSAGSGLNLTVVFTPDDGANYVTASRSVSIDVTIDGRFVPLITWQNPADIPFGTPLGAAQLNATANVPGSFVYAPPAGTVMPIGNEQSLSVSFRPNNTAGYTNASKTVSINVAPPLSRAVVRVAYLIPTNRVAQSGAVSILREALLSHQAWFRDQMELNGFGPKTIAIETEPDLAGGVQPLIHVKPLAETDSYLRGDIFGGRVTNAARASGLSIGAPGELWWLIPETHELNPDGSISGGFDMGHSMGSGGSGDDPGWAIMGSDFLVLCGSYPVALSNASGVVTGSVQSPFLLNDDFYDGATVAGIGPYPLKQGVSYSWFEGSTFSSLGSSVLGAGLRELGEALGLDPDYRNDENFDGNLTGFGFRGIRGVLHPKLYSYNYSRLPYGAALALSVSRYFNPGRPVTDVTKPSVTVTTTGAVTPAEGLVRIAFTAGDSGGLHAALLCWENDDERALVDEMLLSGTNVSRVFATAYYDIGRSNRYTVSVYDLQGNKRDAVTFVLPGVTVNRAPQPFVHLRPVIAGPGEDVLLDASQTFDPEHSESLVEVEWDLDGDGVFDTEPSTDLVFTNHYMTLGHRLIRARVTDPAGGQAVSAPVAVSIVPCAVVLSPVSRTHGFGATSGSITVKVSPKCEWTVSNTNTWITITSGPGGIGPGSVTYAVTANDAAEERSGVVLIGDQEFQIIQRSFACTYSLSPTMRYHGFGTGSGTIKVTTKPECSWTSVNTNTWITITSGGGGTGTGTLAYAVTDNRVATVRTGFLIIADQLFMVGQWGTNCAFVVSPAGRSHGEGSETGLVSVTTSSACGWNVINTNSWITITSAGSAGSGSVGYSVAPNAAFTGRTGVLEIVLAGSPQGQPVVISQAPCAFDISPAGRSHGSGIEVGTVTVTTSPMCHWTVANTSSWVTIISGGSGMGAGAFNYSVAANPIGTPRSAVLAIGNKTFTVTQLGVPCAYQFSGETAGEGFEPEAFHGEGAEVGFIEVTSGPGCPVTVENPAPWVHILSGLPPGGGPALGSTTFIYAVDPNPGPARYAYLTVAGATFQINQDSGLRLVNGENITITGGSTNWMPITLVARGTENSLTFSLCFDTNLLTYAAARPGPAAFGGTLTVSTGSVNGFMTSVGLTLTMPPGWSIPFGNQTVAEISLRAAPISGRPQTPVNFCDQPTPRSILDVLGQPVPVEYGTALVRIFGDCPPAEALDAPQFTWTTSSPAAAGWACQTNVTHDGEDAAASPILPDSGDSWIEATMVGPGTLTFWWKVSSESGSDRLRLYLDGSSQSAYIISGEVDWEQRTFTVPAGSHAVRWRYNKNSSVAGGQDRAWLDEIEFTPAPPIISAHPASRVAELGSTVSLGITAAGSPPLTYQWRHNGNDLSNAGRLRGANTATLTISNAQFLDAGSYSVLVSSSAGSTLSSNALLTVTPVITLAEAVDAPGLAWATNAGTPPAPWTGQTAVSHDGTDAAQSGPIPDSGTTTFSTTLTGPGTLTFWWKVSSQAGSDRLRLYVAGTQVTEISGEIDWQLHSLPIPTGAQTIEWRYTKNGSTSVGQDRGWVDEIRYTPLPPAFTTQPASQAVDANSTVTFTAAATGAPPLAWQWRFNGDDLANGSGVSGATTATLTLTAVQLAQAGTYTVEVRNSADAILSSNALLSVSPVSPLAAALDTTGFTWTTAGTGTPAAGPWTGQDAVTHDGEDAGRSGAIPHSGTGSFQTIVNGPGSVSFWWKASSETNSDRLRLYIAGSSVAEISGETDWQWRSLPFGSGSQTLEWRYTKNSSVSVGQDRGWVDQVLIVTNGAAVRPVIAIDPVAQTVIAGSAASFRVGAAGSTPLGYQWRLNGTNLLNSGGFTGVTTTNLALASAQAAHAGIYSVIVSNAAGTTASSNVTLTVITAPVITNQPANQHVVAGSTVNFSVGAIGLAPLAYQWQFNGSNIVNGGGVSGATTATLTLSAVQTSREGLYSVIVSNAAGTASSSQAGGNLATLDAARTGSAPDGGDTLLATTVTGPGTIRFWWKASSETNSDTLRFLISGVEQARISGEADWRQETFAVPAGAHSLHWHFVKDGAGAAGQDGGWVDTVEFVPDPSGGTTAPDFTSQPSGQSVDAGATINFQAAVSGTPPLSYQWRFNGAALQNGLAAGTAGVSGATTTRLTLAGVQSGRAGTYSLVVTNAAGAATSADAALVINPPVVITNSADLSIMTQPSGRSAGQGGSVTFNVVAGPGGPGPLSYQWRFNGSDLADGGPAGGVQVSGATTPTLTLNNLLPSQAGNYSVVVNNATGAVTSAPAPLTVISLADGVDAPYWDFVMAGNTSWVAQATVTHDGIDAVRSGAIADNQNTRLESWVEGPGSVSFWWKVSSQASVDQLRFYVGTNELARISGEVDWQRLTFAVPAGTQLLKWRYSKDASGVGGQDAGWVDQVEFVPSGPATAPGIVTQPVGQSANPGETILFQAAVSGSAPLNYQWRLNGAALQNGGGVSGATTPRLTLAGVQPGQAGNYSLFVSNAAGTAASDNASLSVAPIIAAPTLTSQPADRNVSEGATASFTVLASGSAPLSFQWRFNGTDLADGTPSPGFGAVSGATTATLTLANVRPDQIGSYSVAVSNSMGVATSARASLTVLTLADAVDAPYLDFTPGGSAAWVALTGVTHERGGARLSVSTPPAITIQPASVSARAGTNVAFNVAASGSAPFSYQWRFNGMNLIDNTIPLTDPGAVTGATTPSLGLSGIFAAQAGNYSVVVSNAVGGATSSNALLTVLSPPSITTQPFGQTVQEGVTVVLNVSASGTAPLGYQWRYNGTNIGLAGSPQGGGSFSGANTATLSLANAQAAQSGAYSVLVTNAVGSALSADAQVVIRAPLSLGDALNSPSLSWSTSISLPWQAQTNVSVDDPADGVFGATRSGVISSNQTTWIETTVLGPGTVRFWWKVSSQTNRDVLRFLIGSAGVPGVERDQISGEIDWTWRTFDVPPGFQSLRWAYSKDATLNAGQDRGWLDAVEFVPTVGPSVPVIIKHPVGGELLPGASITFTTEAEGTPPLSYQWTYNGIELLDSDTVSGAATPTLTVASLSSARQGTYQLVVRNPYSLAVSSNAFLRVLPFIPLANALDTGTTNMLWISGGASSWFGQDAYAHDRVDAAQSGVLAHNRTNWMETTVAGPIAISFWWKTSSETNRDRLRFYINGIEHGNLSGEADWRWRTFDVNHLTATLRWAYTKDATNSFGLDRAWVDDITSGPMAPVITNGPNDITLVDEGTTVKLRVETAGTPPFGFQWRRSPSMSGAGATNLLESTNFFGAETSRTLSLSNAQPWQSGVYSVVASNAAGVSLSETGHVVILPGLPLPPALNTPTWVWRTGGDAHWIGDSSDSHDGSQAARNGVIASSSSGGIVWMETTVIGPGTVRYWWKVSSRTNQDFARFAVNDVELATISGTKNWHLMMFDLDAGTNIMRWAYTRNGILTNGQNRAWVDEVFFGAVAPMVTNQPAGRAVDAGSTVNLSVGVRGTPPLSYRWRLNGVNLNDGGGVSGATSATLSLANIQTAQAGSYSVVINNPAGSVTSSNAVVTVTPILPLAQALDTTNLTWTTSGNATWVGQPVVSHDGVDAARIGNMADSQSATLQTTLTGPGMVSFWWKVSSQANNDYLRFYVDGVEQAAISGEVDWQSRTFSIPEGTVPLRWTYAKNGSVAAGQDRAWVDQVVISAVAPNITSQPASQSVDAGQTVTFSVAAVGTPPITYQWRFNGANIADGALPGGAVVSGATTTTLRVTGVTPAQAGSFSVVVRNEAASVASASAVLSIAAIVPLAEALDTTGMTWATNGNPPWVGQTAVSHDGADAARSGAIPDSGTTSFSTSVAGPGTVTFWWKVSSQAGSDRLRFYVNGTQVAEVSGEVDWTLYSQNLSSGNQTLEWRYTKNGSTAAGLDRGWVDQVQFGQLPPTIAVQPASRAIDAGGTVSFTVAAGGTPPFTYQWQRNGVPLANGPAGGGVISGATTSNLTLTGVLISQAGNYSVVVANNAGTVTSASAALTVSPILTLAEALDTSGLTWATNGNPPWVGQTAVSHDGADAARSGAIADSGTTSFSTSVAGPGTLTFWWKVSSQAGSDRLRFYLNGTQVTEISGEIDWTLVSQNISSGNQTLEWRYTKNGSTSVGQDRAWVDEIRFGPAAPIITTQPASQSVNAGSTVTLSVVVLASPPVTYQWRFGGANLADGGNVSGATTASLTLDSVPLAQAGNYSVVVTSGGISTTSTVAVLTVVPVIPLADALDAPDLVWSTGGSVGTWSGQTAVRHDGVDAAQSGTAGASQYTFIKTTVTGPGTLTFWWKVSSEATKDFLRLMLNGVDQTTISGEVDWQFQTFSVPAGSVQELQWRFSHNSSGTAGQDRAWVDQVAYTPDAAPSPLPGDPAPTPVPPGNAPAPVVSRIEVTATKAVLTWDARPTKTYQVLYKDNLTDPEWQILDGEVLIRWKIVDETVVSDSVIASMEDVLAGKTRYYRVVEY